MRIGLVIASLWALSGCIEGPGLFDQAGNSEDVVATLTENGVATGTVVAGSSLTQLLQAAADSAIAGSSVSFPPGSLSIDSAVTIEESSDIANSSTASNLGLDGGDLSSASSAVYVSSSVSQDASSPFTLQIPVSSGLVGFGLSTQRLIVVYKVIVASEGGKVVEGVIPPDQVTKTDGVASFKTSNFGSFQLAYTTADIRSEIRKDAKSPILSKREARKLPSINWAGIHGHLEPGNRAMNVSADLTGAEIERCLVEIDDDRTPPFLQVIERNNAAPFRVYATSPDAQTFHGRFVCTLKDGRVERSNWTPPAIIKKLEAIVTESGGTYTIAGVGVRQYAWSQASSAIGCATAAYSSFQDVSQTISGLTGNGVVCVKGKDVSGNVQSQPTVSALSYKPLKITGDLDMTKDVYTLDNATNDRTFFQSGDGYTDITLEGDCPTPGSNVKVAGDINHPTSASAVPFEIPCDASGRFSLGINQGAPTTNFAGLDNQPGGKQIIVRQSGSEANAYYLFTTATGVYTAGSLPELQTAKDSGGASATIVLTDDIDMTAGMAPAFATFSGTFFGQGHKLSHFTRTSGGNAGLFTVLGSNAHISHVKLYDFTIGALGSTVNAGALAAYTNSTGVTVQDITVEGGIIEGDTAAGGVLGDVFVADTTMKNNHVEGATITASGSGYAGGIVGKSLNSSISTSSAYNNILAGYWAGGIAGLFQTSTGAGTARVARCYVQRGTINATFSGGIVGKIQQVMKAIDLTQVYMIDVDPSSSANKGVGYASKTGTSVTASDSFYYSSHSYGADPGFITFKSDGAMKQQATYTNWNFDNLWKIEEGLGYPKFKWQD